MSIWIPYINASMWKNPYLTLANPYIKTKGIEVIAWIIPAKRVQVEAAAKADRVLREPPARDRVVPPGAEVDEASRRRPLAALEAVAVHGKRNISGCDAPQGMSLHIALRYKPPDIITFMCVGLFHFAVKQIALIYVFLKANSNWVHPILRNNFKSSLFMYNAP